jgi:hypothetical protein
VDGDGGGGGGGVDGGGGGTHTYSLRGKGQRVVQEAGQSTHACLKRVNGTSLPMHCSAPCNVRATYMYPLDRCSHTSQVWLLALPPPRPPTCSTRCSQTPPAGASAAPAAPQYVPTLGTRRTRPAASPRRAGCRRLTPTHARACESASACVSVRDVGKECSVGEDA